MVLALGRLAPWTPAGRRTPAATPASCPGSASSGSRSASSAPRSAGAAGGRTSSARCSPGSLLPLIVGRRRARGARQPSAGTRTASPQRMAAALGVVRNVWTDLVVLGRPHTTEYGPLPPRLRRARVGRRACSPASRSSAIAGRSTPSSSSGSSLLANMALTEPRPAQLSCVAVQRRGAAAPDPDPRVRGGGHLGPAQDRRPGRGRAAVPHRRRGVRHRGRRSARSLLTATASSAPLQGLWQDLPSTSRASRSGCSSSRRRAATPAASAASPSATTRHDRRMWQPSDAIAFRAQLPPAEDGRVQVARRRPTPSTRPSAGTGARRRATTDAGRRRAAPGTATADEPSTARPPRDRPSTSPPTPTATRRSSGPNTLAVGRPPDRSPGSSARDGWFTTVESTERLEPLQRHRPGPRLRGRCRAASPRRSLRAAGTDYPAERRGDLYTRCPSGAHRARRATQLLAGHQGGGRSRRRRRPGQPLRPRPDDGGLPPQPGQLHSTTRTSATSANARAAASRRSSASRRIQAGYCDYYASTMAVLLRAVGRPGARRLRLPARRAAATTTARRSCPRRSPTAGSRCTSRASAGSSSTRPAAASASPRRSRPAPLGPPTPRPSLQSAGRPRHGRAADVRDRWRTTTGGTGHRHRAVHRDRAHPDRRLVALALRAAGEPRSKPMDPDQAWGSLARLAARFGPRAAAVADCLRVRRRAR